MLKFYTSSPKYFPQSSSRIYLTRSANKIPKDSVDFGFKKVDRSEKEKLVKQLFDKVSHKYDLMNDLMSLGLHRWWKRDFVRQLAINDGIRICDMAGGTGDISAQILSMNPDTDLRIDICDLSSEMIERGKENLKSNKINWHCCNAEKLPFEDSSFDIYTIAFGIRNVTNMNKVLKECNRVLKPNGRFVCLEFSNVDNLLLNNLYRYYSFKIIPIIGYLVAGDWDAYQYLVESIEKFPKKELFTEIIRENNFENVEYNSLNGGIVCIHSGYKV